MERTQSLQMHNILFYIIFAQHTEFVSLLIQEMLINVKSEYKGYGNTYRVLCQLENMLRDSVVSHKHCVVIFFFFLTIDSKMRHWILNSQLSEHESQVRDALLRVNVQLVPGAAGNLGCHSHNPFLGQHVALQPLDPHIAVPILTTIIQENFFQPIFTSQDPASIDRIFEQLKTLVIFA